MTQRHVVLLGASGQIGWFLVPRLLAAGYRVSAVSRNGRPQGFPELEGVAWVTPGQWDTGECEETSLVSAGPLNLALSALAELPGLRRIVAFSTTSALTKQDSPDPSEHDQIAEIRQTEARLVSACARERVECCLLRPTLIYGCGMDGNVSRLATMIARLPIFPLAGLAMGQRQPVHADDLAAAAVAALLKDSPLPQELTLCGGSTLSYRDMLVIIATAQGRRLRPVRLPERWLVAALKVFGFLPALRGVNAEMLRRQNRDLVFDDAAARTLLGWRPRPFDPTPQDFTKPSEARILALSGRSGSGVA